MAQIDNPLDSLSKNFGVQSSNFGPAEFWKTASPEMSNIGDVVVDSLFFNWMNLEAGDAWKIYPYQFEIHDGVNPLSTLTMPLAPESISINVPSAVTTTVTMRGITEEHNDAPLRQITITGTTGIMPNAAAELSNSGPSSLLEYAFKNTIQSFNKAKTTFEKTASAFQNVLDGGGRTLNSPVAFVGDLTDEKVSNGYTAIHNMSRFFDSYLAAKQKGATKMFLSFYMHKDQMYYDCTLNNYSIRKVAGSMEYQYTVSLTAWRRRDRPVGILPRPGAITRTSASDDPLGNILAAINNYLTGLIKGINELGGVLKGFSKDSETVVLGPIKKIGLLIKTMLNLATTIADFPNALALLAKNAIKSAFKKTSQQNNQGGKLEELNKLLKDKKALYSPGAYSSNVIANSVQKDEGSVTADDSVEKTEETSDPFDKIFEDPQEFADVFSFFTTDELEMSDKLSGLLQDEIDKALALTSGDVVEIRNNFENFIATYSESVGGGDETYNRLNDRGSVRSVFKTLSVNDIATLSLFNDGMQALDSVIVLLTEKENSQTTQTDYASYFAEQARSYGIDFAENTSKFYVPFEFGSSLERMAVKYLGSDTRWIEIAAINALKAPYVDEDGFYIDFSASGAGNSFSVMDVTNLYIGQIVELSSDSERPMPRQITAIDVVSSVESIITVKGEADLARFTTSQNAKMRAFLPNTTNSNQLIAIPSAVSVNIPGTIALNPDKEDLTLITLTAKADFMLSFNKQNTADIAFTGADVKIARGMNNIIQAATIKILTKQGDLIQDPTFGNPIQVGSSTADINAQSVLKQLSVMYQIDPRFQSVKAGRVKKTGNALIVDMVLGLQNSQAYLPFTASLPIGV